MRRQDRQARRTRSPRRLSPGARREQLVEAASAEIAKQGFADFSLDAVAERADVTRNLLYHYFPRGRIDLFLAALDRAGSELTEGWVMDSDLPVAERTAANFERVADHVMAPTDAWLVYRQAGGSRIPRCRRCPPLRRPRLSQRRPEPARDRRPPAAGRVALAATWPTSRLRSRRRASEASSGRRSRLVVETLTPTVNAVASR